MLGIITSLISAALCLAVYVRMIRREIPEPMPKKKAIIPVVVGVFSTFLATVGTLLAGLSWPAAARAVAHGFRCVGCV